MEKKEQYRLDKILATTGRGSRTEVKKLIRKGQITVDGEVITDPGFKFVPGDKVIQVDGEIIQFRKYIYIMMNKPAGYISATEDEREKTVLELLSPEYQAFHPFPAGRLDKDTVGLLLLTNDGTFAHKLTSPKKKVPKIYYALIEGEVNKQDQIAFSEGLILEDGYQTLPAELKIYSSGVSSEVEVVLYEGKYHQVKRMFQSCGKKVMYLKRVSIGPLKLDETLEPGAYRELTEEELNQFRN